MMLQRIKKLVEKAQNKKWYKTYWAFDLHGTLAEKDKDKTKFEDDYIFYPYALECLKLLTERADIVMILSTSAYPKDLGNLLHKQLLTEGVYFDYINENPEIDDSKGHFGYYKEKYYFDLLFEDRAGFEPSEWKKIYKYLNSKEFLKPKDEWAM